MARRKASGFATIAVFVAVFVLICGIFLVVLLVPDDDASGAKPDRGMYFEYMNVDITWNADRSCSVKEEIKVHFLETSHGIYIDIPVNSGEKVRDITVETQPERDFVLSRESGNNIIRARVGDEDRTFKPGSVMVCSVTYDMITPAHPSGADILAFNAIGSGWQCRTKQAKVRMTYPAAPEKTDGEFGIWLGGKKVDGNTKGVTVAWSNGNKTVDIAIVGRVGGELFNDDYALDWFENVELAYKLPDGTLRDYSDNGYIVTLCVGLAILVLAVVLKLLFRNKELTPIVDFYPPRIDGRDGRKRHMLPVQMGKIIDGSCSPQDVTSLIFYWASNGYLAIEEKDGETYLKKLSDIEEVTGYEKKLFEKIFSYGDPDENGVKTVSLSDLKYKLSGAINNVKSGVNGEYGGKFYKKSSIAAAVTIGVFGLVYGLAVVFYTSLRAGLLLNILGLIAAVVVVGLSSAAGVMLALYRNKLSDGKRKTLTALYFIGLAALSVLVSLTIPLDVTTWLERIIFAVCLCVPIAIMPFCIVRTDFYVDLLNNILGFRNFLRDAEKERLETLLESDPQYYYNILPYANVLGVSDIWENKFKNITVEPPAYYYGNTSLFDIYVMTRVMSSVGSTLVALPKSGGGSFSSIGGGRSGGGGFSGGSFGGGGGGRW